MKIALPLHSGGYGGDSVDLSSFRCVNLYPEQIIGDAGPLALIGTPGFTNIDTLGAGPIRGAIEHLGDAYFVSGNEIIKYTTAGVQTSVGNISLLSSGLVSMSSNGISGGQITLTDGVGGFVCDGSTTAQIVDAQFLASPTKTCFIDGYTVCVFANSDYFQLSDPYDSTSWTTAYTARAERDPDNLVNCAANNRQLWLFGERTTEIWYNSGATFPFDPLPNGFLEVGLHAPDSLVNLEQDGLIWLSQDKKGKGKVVRASGASYKEVTTPQILSEWRTYADLSDATAFGYQEAGHTFYVLTFPTANKTWVYDVTTNLWHERMRGQAGAINANAHIYFNNQHIVGDNIIGTIYEMSIGTYTDDTDYIHRYFTTPHVSEDGGTIRHNCLELDVEAGVGVMNGQGVNPSIWMDYSDDGGHLYNNKRFTSLGIGGDFKKKVAWPLLGKSDNRVYRIGTSEPVKIRLSRLLLDFNMGADYQGKLGNG